MGVSYMDLMHSARFVFALRGGWAASGPFRLGIRPREERLETIYGRTRGGRVVLVTYRRCGAMLRHFLRDFDGAAASWLVSNEALVEEFMIKHLDRLTPSERAKLYVMLFGFFRNSYKRVIDLRLQIEKDPKCKEVLHAVAQQHIFEIQQPYSPVSTEALLAGCEENLRHQEPVLRFLGALGVWTISRDSSKILPILRAIVRDRHAGARGEAATLLGDVGPPDEETIRLLRAVADDPTDPVRSVAEKILKRA